MPDITTFFENLNGFFKDELDLVADVPCSVHKNEESGEIEEIRIYNPEYDQLIFINRSGTANFINVSEEKERLEKLAEENRIYAPRTRKTAPKTETKSIKKTTAKKPPVSIKRKLTAKRTVNVSKKKSI